MIRRLSPLIVFAILACILLWPVLFGGRVLLPGGMLQKMSPWNASASKVGEAHWNALTWDSIAYFYPSRALLGRAVRSGELPLWNPYQMCGMPFLADYQSAVLYPPNLLFAVAPTDRAFGLLAFLHLLAAGSFTFVFLRGLGVGKIGATFGGTAFMLSAFAITWLELPVFLSTAVWLPLALHYSRIAHETRAARYTGLAAIAIALSLVGGHPQIAFYCLLAVALYWVYLTIVGWPKTSIPRSLIFMCMTFAIGLALAAPQLLPSAELSALSHRGGSTATAEGYAAYSALAMPWQSLAMLFAPSIFGSGFAQYAEYCGYIGILTLLLIPIAFGLKSRAQRHSWFFGTLGALALLMALGTGVNQVFYFAIPGFSHSGSPARALFLFMFSASILGAVGLDRIVGDSDDEKRGGMVFTLLCGGIVVLASAVALAEGGLVSSWADLTATQMLRSLLPAILPFIGLLVIGLLVLVLTAMGKLSRDVVGALAICIVAADLLAFGMWYNPTCKRSEVYPKTATTSFLQGKSGSARIMPLNDDWSLSGFPNAVLPPNSATAYRLYDVQGYDAFYPVRYKALLDAAGGRDSCPRENGNMVFARNPASPVYDLLGVRWIVSLTPVQGARKTADGCFVVMNKKAFPRAFLTHMVEYADQKEMLQRIVEGDQLLQRVALIDANDGGYLDPWQTDQQTATAIVTADRAEIVKYTCNTVTVKVEASRAGILVLTDQFYPGWEATVDGKRANVGRVDYILRGVAVQAGKHTVKFTYTPDSFYRGLRLMKMALVLLACFGIYSFARSFERRRTRA